MELVLYYIKESSSLLISFLILIFILGIIMYLSIRKFRQGSKVKVGTYGLFLGLKNIDIVKLSIIISKTFLAVYSTMITDKVMVYISILMLIILTFIYIILSPKKLVYETVYTFMEIVLIYFIFTINNYMVEVEFSIIILMIKICLIIFVLVMSTYLLLKNFNNLVEYRWDKEFSKKQRKEISDGE